MQLTVCMLSGMSANTRLKVWTSRGLGLETPTAAVKSLFSLTIDMISMIVG